MKKPKYTTTFSSVIKPVVSEEKDKYLALASMVELEKFLPQEAQGEKECKLIEENTEGRVKYVYF